MTEPFNTQPSCADASDPEALGFYAARQRILNSIEPLQGREKVALRQAHKRYLGADLVSPLNVPNHTNSAMDGYALRGGDLPHHGTARLRIIASLMAGQRFDGVCGAAQCIRIMTGAPMPTGTDSVVMREHVQLQGQEILIDSRHRPGQNVRQAGEDIAKGAVVLRRGRRLTASDLGIMASLGIAEASVIRRPRVAFFSTGDELRSVGEILAEGDVYDSNRYTLFAMLENLGVELRDLGVVRDDPQALRQAFAEAAAEADVVITSGGVSMGDADYIKPVLAELGEVDFWKIDIKPGRPLAYGKLGGAQFFGLPGNPVAVMLTFYQFVQPALQYLASGVVREALLLPALASEAIRKKPGRFEFPRGFLQRSADGVLTVARAGAQGSGILSTMSRANCYLLLDESRGNIEPGETVTVQPFADLL